MKNSFIYDLVCKIKKQQCTSDPFELAEMLGIRIEYEKLNNVKGLYVSMIKHSFIVLNEDINEDDEKLVIYHEIGHHILHRHLATAPFQERQLLDTSSRTEMEANIFAANMIIEDEDVICYANQNCTSEFMAKSLMIPHELVLIKLKDMNNRGYDFNLAYNPRANFLGK